MSRLSRVIAGFLVVAAWAVASPAVAGDSSAESVWTRVAATELARGSQEDLRPWIQPTRFQAVRLSADALQPVLDGAPLEGTGRASTDATILVLPTPDGRFEKFSIVESPVMEPGLEAWMARQGWPMRTYRGTSLEHPATTVRLDWGGPAGFHASVLSPGRSYYIDPYWQGDVELYTSYFRSEYVREHEFQCLVHGDVELSDEPRSGGSTNGNLRSYRLVVAATGEYTVFHGGTQVAGQAAIVTTVNRVNQVYENDVSIRMVLVANNIDVVYTNPTTDPYTNDDGFTMLSENQANLNSVIGSANYDIGHVVSTGGGGIAGLGVVCTASKARGVTGSPAPVGDPFDIDYVAHEMGHQWGGNHSFNSVTGSCGGGNRNASTAYEPGSGSTIMAYAGICGADDLQAHSDPYFHGISLDEILNYSAGTGSCSTNTPVNPNAPTVDAGPAYTIPANTPFELTVASSNDADGDTLSFTWEQFNLGVATTLASGDNGSSPILRSWPPTTDTVQTFPNNGVTVEPGETLPTTNRTVTFRLTARDNRAGGGRVGEDTTTLTSTTSAGPFEVTSPNGGESWSGTQTVTWNVAGTTGAGVNTANVDILLSTDGGATWPTVLAAATPNDGSQSVTLPTVDTAFARIKVKGSGNVFYDTSDGNFTLGTIVNESLFDQSTNCATAGSTSQYFTDYSNGSEIADDFVVPVGEHWTLGHVSAPGSFNSGGVGPLTSVNVTVWTDGGTIPATVVSGCSFPSVSPASGLSDPVLSIDLPPTCILVPGTYWVEVQAVMPFNPNGQWFWRRSLTTNGQQFAFRDLGNLFGLGCTAWSPQGGCLAAAETDMCFAISGSSAVIDLIFEDGFESGNVTAWSTSVP